MAHLTPRYILDRALLFAHATRNPEVPWLTPQATELLRRGLRTQDYGLEWGSGRSTPWLAERTRFLISVETSKAWFERVGLELRRRGLSNVDYRYIAPEVGPTAYASVGVNRLLPESLDYVMIDGLHRAVCALAVVDLIKPGGLLIIDNAERYLPYPSRSPERLRGQPCTAWRDFLARVAGWRLIWTTSGVNDTALWIKTS